MNIKELIKEAHDNAVERGFYPEGKEQNIGEKLMLIISELGEALEAHRCGRFADWESYERGNQQLKDSCSAWKDIEDDMMFIKEGRNYFLSYIKDTLGDELADVFIRLFDLCGYLEIEPTFRDDIINKDLPVNIGERLLNISGLLCEMHIDPDTDNPYHDYISDAMGILYLFSKEWNIPVEKHIRAKMAYNRTRGHKHGKEY